MVRPLLLMALVGFATLARANGILILGDSISAAYGIEKSQGWVHLFEQSLDASCSNLEVINASVSGETTAGGKSRLPGLLEQHQPEIVVIELGGNDGLRGLSPIAMRQNIAQMVSLSRESGATPVLLGMRIPPNYGEQYARLFEQQFAQVARELDVPLFPFFLEGVFEQDGIQKDGIHPTADVQPLLLDNALTVIGPLLPVGCASVSANTADQRAG
ncbi:MAG: arylesterase [Alcanivoracaceae bacterium]|nr:arylesterase [Alcanivoracaceae bacterium]|tara:strand:- start:2578 stop:3225 length:648 start_codon:yes stop_codon:yes gene_type:complete